MLNLKRPSPTQHFILMRMETRGWTIRNGPVSAELRDARDVVRRKIPQKTLRVLIGEGWIKYDAVGKGVYSISGRGSMQAITWKGFPRKPGIAS